MEIQLGFSPMEFELLSKITSPCTQFSFLFRFLILIAVGVLFLFLFLGILNIKKKISEFLLFYSVGASSKLCNH